MAEALSEHLLGPGKTTDVTTLSYLTYLAEQPVESLQHSEPHQLSQASHSLLLSVQSLSKKRHKQIAGSAARHSSMRHLLPTLSKRTNELAQVVPKLDNEAEAFSTGFSKAGENGDIAYRKQALRLLQNAERLVDVMDLPPLLSSAVKSNPATYSSILDLFAHVRRLASLYPSSPLVTSVTNEADNAVRQMASDLIKALKTPNIKLAPSLRTVGWLKRIVPELVSDVPTEEALPAVFLVCRLSNLIVTLDALNPLRQLAEEERLHHANAPARSAGKHTERYLKRFIEVFREHSFGIISVSKSVDASFSHPTGSNADPLYPLPSTLASFPLHLIGLLIDTIQNYLPSIQDQASRESILTQVFYCAGSLGRLGADFGMLLSSIIGMSEWIDLVKRNRLLAGRLESVIGDYRGNQAVTSNSAKSAAHMHEKR